MSKRDDDIEIVEEEESTSSLKTPDTKKLKEQLEACKKERQEYLDGWQRAKADFINGKKRLEDEASKKFEYGIEKAVEKLLPALDSLDIALSQGDNDGLQMIQKQLLEALEVEILEPLGEQFDPVLHESLGTTPTDNKEEDGKITHILQKGYRRGERIIRPAKVHVATHNE